MNQPTTRPHWCSLIIMLSVSVFLCVITGVFCRVGVKTTAAMAMNKYKSNRSGGSEKDRWRRGRVGCTRVEKYVLWECVSGQVAQSWRLAVILKIYAVESGKSLSASRHCALPPSLLLCFSLHHFLSMALMQQVVASLCPAAVGAHLSGHQDKGNTICA